MKADIDRLYGLIGARLKSQRTALGLTQEQLANPVGFERTSITNIEKGRQRLSIHALYEICFALQIEVRDVLPPVDEVMARDQRALARGFKGDEENAPEAVGALIRKVRNESSEGND